MSFDFLNTFAAEFGEKLKIDKGKNKIAQKDSDLMEIDEVVTEMPLASSSKISVPVASVPVALSKVKNDIKFDHSMDAVVKSGVYKGRKVEVRYFLPSSYEVEIGINYDIDSENPLEKGQIIDHCVVLAEIGVNKYLTHCKKKIFFDDTNIKHIKDDIVIIRGGMYKGMMGRVIKYNESKIGVLLVGSLDGNPIILKMSELFFNDLLLQNGKNFQVKKILLEDGVYKMYGFEFGNQIEMVITSDDVLEMSPGFKIYDKSRDQITEDTREDDMFSEVGDEVSDDEGEFEESGEVSGYEDEFEEGEEIPEIPEMRSVFADKMRVYEEKSLSKKKAVYYDIVKKILEVKNIGIDDIGNIYDLVDEIDIILDKISDNLKISGSNFDIRTSLIDLRMIIACMVAYKIVGNGIDLGGFPLYVSELYENGIFVGDVKNSVLLEAPDVFNCTNLRRTNIELKKIEMLMVCFDKELQNLLNLQIRFAEIKPIGMGELIAIKKRPGLFSKRKFSTMEDVKRGAIPIGAKKMVWSGKQMMKIKGIKKKLDTKNSVDKYIYENIENSPLLLKSLRDNVVQYLFNKYGNDFMNDYNKCNDEKCQDRVISEYIKEIKRKNEVINKYMKMLDIVFEIMNDTSETDISTAEENIRKRLRTLGIDNSNLIKKK